MTSQSKSPAIHSPLYDTIFIMAPPFLCLLVILLFPAFFQNQTSEPEWIWLLLVVFIDVGHVYSTIYRTYFDKEIIEKNKSFFYTAPVLMYITGVALYSMGTLVFWRCMAYLAVFHFVRQQYGFMRLYSRHDEQGKLKYIDTLTIYAATVYPLLYWHFTGKQQFNWFIDGDFYYFNNHTVLPFLSKIYYGLLLIYIVKELYILRKSSHINIYKNILILGTVVSWYFGIVYFKGDLTFTLLNVVSHGIPYYALVWAHGNKRSNAEMQPVTWLKQLFKPANVFGFLIILFILAYLEELIWDGLVWKDHFTLFPTSQYLPDLTDKSLVMTLLIPLLALPQLLHYFIDGFIWKMKKDQYNWFVFFK